MLRLLNLQVKGNLILHLIHILGTRTIYCGIDELPGGITKEGVMAGHPLLGYILLNLDCLQRSGKIKPWIMSWWPTKERGGLKLCTSDDWYKGTNNDGCYLWTPPPAAVDAAVE